jgi:type III secretion system FlhB-like substrate exporter
MTPALSAQQNASLAARVRQRLVDEAVQAQTALQASIRAHLITLLDEVTPMREQQLRRDTWTLYEQIKGPWLVAVLKDWQAGLNQVVERSRPQTLPSQLELVSTETVENRMLASRMALSLMEVAASEVNDLRKRLRHLELAQELSAQDIVHPEVLLQPLVEQWVACGMSLESWTLIYEVVQHHINTQWRQIYANCNAELVAQGVLPVIAFEPRAKPRQEAAPPADYPQHNHMPGQDQQGAAPGWRSLPGGSAQGWPAAGFHAGAATHDDAGWPAPAGTAVAPPRSGARDVGLLDRVGRMMSGVLPAQNFAAVFRQVPSQSLMTALAQRPVLDDALAGAGSAQLGSVLLERLAGELQQQSAELKNLAQNDNEKAIIELIALMFQSILQEDRIPPGIRVWFARLQMPVLGVALAEPDFFNRLDHPARRLIDHMGSCALGFDASDISSEALETEIKRVVQVIEQYPETGARVYQRVYEEFKEFLKRYLTQKGSTQKVVGVAQQVEQKETLAIQCTIELRNQIKNMPVRDEIRDFLYKVWAEVIAVASMRQGGQHAQTLLLKKTAADLIWAASAKPNRTDRAQVIANLPELLKNLRAGMGMLGLSSEVQDGHLTVISDILADAFMAKTQTIEMTQIQALAERLANLEDYFTDDGAEELPLDAQSIEDLLGIDASELDVVTSGGVEPSPVMMVWAQNLSLGAWFTLDYLGQSVQVQYMWRSPIGHLHLFASVVGRSYLIQSVRLAAYLEAGLLAPQEEVSLTVRATRSAMAKLEANPERLLG